MNADLLIKQYCKELRFGKNIYENYSNIDAADHGDFLAQLLKMELDHREMSRKNRNLKSAGFDLVKIFDGYEFENIQIPSAISIEDLKTGAFVDKLENLILYGPVGTGKTHNIKTILQFVDFCYIMLSVHKESPSGETESYVRSFGDPVSFLSLCVTLFYFFVLSCFRSLYPPEFRRNRTEPERYGFVMIRMKEFKACDPIRQLKESGYKTDFEKWGTA